MQGLKEGLKQDNILLSYLNSKQLIRGEKKNQKFNLVNKQTQRWKEKIFFLSPLGKHPVGLWGRQHVHPRSQTLR